MFLKKYVSYGITLLLMLTSATIYGQQAKDITFTTNSPEAMKLFLEGLDLMDNFRYAEAAAPLEKAVKADPDFAIAYDFWGATAPTTDERLKRFRKAFELAPKASEAERLIILSDKALFENKPDSAEANLRKVVELLPDGKRAHYILAMFLNGQQKYPEAEKEYNKAISLDPNFAPAYNNLAYFLSTLDRYPEAIKALQKYVELKPLEPNPHDSMGEIYLWMGDYDNSFKEYSNALKLDPNFVSSLAGLGHNYVFKGEFDNARGKYNEMLAHAHNVSDTIMAYYWKTVSYVHEKNYDAAIGVLNDELGFAQARNDIYLIPDIHFNLATVYSEKGDFDKALDDVAVDRKLAMNPGIDSVSQKGYLRGCLLMETDILARQGKIDLASAKVAEFQKSIQEINNPALTRNNHGAAGIVAFYQKDYSTAINELKQSDPSDQYCKYYLGLSYDMSGQKDQAKKIFSEIAKYNRNGLDYAIVRPAALAKM